MAQRYASLLLSVVEWDDPDHDLVSYSGLDSIATVKSAEVIKKLGAMNRGKVTFYPTDDWEQFIQEGRILSLYQYNAVATAAGGTVPPNREMGSILIEKVKERLTASGERVIEVTGLGPEKLLTRFKHWQPIGEENTHTTELAEPVAAPFATTLKVGAPKGNKSCTMNVTVEAAGAQDHDEIHIELDDSYGTFIGTILHAHPWGNTPAGDQKNQMSTEPRTPYKASIGNDVEIWKCNLQVALTGNAQIGQLVEIELDDTTTHTAKITYADPDSDDWEIDTGFPSAASAGNWVKAYDFSEPATDDVTQIMAPAVAAGIGWAVEFENVAYEGTENGTAHAPKGDSVWDLLLATAEQSGEFFRIKSLEDGYKPRKKLIWRRTHDSSGMTLYLRSSQSDVATDTENVNRGVIHSIEREATADVATRIYPTAADGRINLSYCTDTVLAEATAAGFTVVLSTDTWRPDYVQYDAGVTAHGVLEMVERYGNITLTDRGSIGELQAAADAMLRQAMTSLLEMQPREYWRVRCHTHRPLLPGQTVVINNSVVEPTTTGTFYIQEVRETYDATAKGVAGVIMTDLVLSAEPQVRVSPMRSMSGEMRNARLAVTRPSSATESTAMTVGGTTRPAAPFMTAGNELIEVAGANIYGRYLAGPVFNLVTDFGADNGGTTDATTALAAALAAADAAAGGVVYLPQGTYKLTVYDKDDTDRLILPENVVLRGEGYNTVIKLNASPDYLGEAQRKFAFIDATGNNLIENLRIDGNKANVALSGTDTKFNGIRVAANAQDILIRNVWVHDLDATTDQEAFGIETRSGCGNVTIDNVTAWEIAGSGISISNDEPLPSEEAVGGGYFQVTNCRCYSNDWQGITIYGAQHVTVVNCSAYDNAKIGFNIEYSGAVILTGCEAYGNGEQNLRVMGYSHVIANGCYFHDSGGTNEISIQQGGYYREIDGDDPIACPAYVGIYNCRVLRGTDTGEGTSVRHLQLRTTEETSGKTLFGGGYPVVTVDGPGTQGWEIAGWRYEDVSATLRVYPPGLTLKGWVAARSIASRRFEDWLMTGDITRDLTVESGSLGTYPATFSGTAENAQAYTDTVLLGNRRYHVKVRAKVTQATGATIDDPDIWSVTFNRVGGAGAGPGRFALGALSYSGDWVEGEAIIETGAGTFRPGLFYQSRSATASGASTITLDYLVVTEMGWTQGATEFDQWGAKRIDHGDSIPITGTWHGGDAVLRSNPSEPGGIGWTVEQAGTYGTLTDVTGSITDGSTSATFAGANLAILEPGHYVTLEGDETVYQIVYISSGAATISPRAVTTLSGVAVSWSPPTWKEWGIVGAPRELVLPMESEVEGEAPEAVEYRAELARATYGKAYIRWVEEL